MDELFEFIFEILLDIGAEASQNKRIPKWIRYPLLVIFVLLFVFVFGVLLLVGFTSLKTDPLLGSILIGGAILLAVGLYFKYKDEKKKRRGRKSR